jgi:hypothetical protein
MGGRYRMLFTNLSDGESHSFGRTPTLKQSMTLTLVIHRVLKLLNHSFE